MRFNKVLTTRKTKDELYFVIEETVHYQSKTRSIDIKFKTDSFKVCLPHQIISYDFLHKKIFKEDQTKPYIIATEILFLRIGDQIVHVISRQLKPIKFYCQKCSFKVISIVFKRQAIILEYSIQILRLFCTML